jgi:diguanylate cyclase (GGDEF)-like protein/PAS domain S-box-containing protein
MTNPGDGSGFSLGLRFWCMATPIFKAKIDPENEQDRSGNGGKPRSVPGLNLPQSGDSNQQLQILDALPVLVFLERDGRILYANAEARRMLGFKEAEWTERPVEDVLWGLYPGTAEPQTRLTGTEQGSPFHATMPAANGQITAVEGTYSVLDATAREAVIIAHPAGRERAPRSRMMEDVLASIPEAVAIEHDNHVLYTNSAFTQMFGYAEEEVSGGSLRKMIVPETRWSELAALERIVDEQGRVVVETVRTTSAGELIDVSMQCAPLLVDGNQVGHVYTFRDIAERKLTEDRLQHDAMHDVLTGLPNRALFFDRVNVALRRRTRHPEQSCGVLILDLDHFKKINETLGHAAGDALLAGVADRLSAVLRPHDSAARLSGDEFALLVEGIQGTSDLEAVAQRIQQKMGAPFDVFGQAVHVEVSLGAALAGQAHEVAESLMHDADYALNRAKEAGSGRYEIFDKHLELCISRKQERERDMRMALKRRQFEFRYQPVYSLHNGRIECMESILHWFAPGGEAETSGELLEVAQKSGMEIGLGKDGLEGACHQVRACAAASSGRACNVSVNLTAHQLFHPDLVAQLQSVLEQTGTDPAALQIEVPERALNENPDAAVAILQRIADCRVRITIDSFGSDLAPLNHLVRLPVDAVKLDPKLTQAAIMPGRQQTMLGALIKMAHTLGIQVCAQGIETPEQLQTLIRLGCDMGQGPLLGQPLEAEQAIALVAKES